MPEETYYQKNKDRQLALAKKYREEHKEQYQSYYKTWYLANREKVLEKRKEYARKNKEKIYEKYRTIYYPRHQAKKEEAAPPSLPVVLSPHVELPRYTMFVTEGTVEVRFD